MEGDKNKDNFNKLKLQIGSKIKLKLDKNKKAKLKENKNIKSSD